MRIPSCSRASVTTFRGTCWGRSNLVKCLGPAQAAGCILANRDPAAAEAYIQAFGNLSSGAACWSGACFHLFMSADAMQWVNIATQGMTSRTPSCTHELRYCEACPRVPSCCRLTAEAPPPPVQLLHLGVELGGEPTTQAASTTVSGK